MRSGALWPTMLAIAACTPNSVSNVQGIREPIVVDSAQFIAGALPGLPPPDASTDAGPGANPQVTDINLPNAALREGEQGLAISGHATTDAQTVAVRFADLGTGYWVVPLGAADPSDDGLLTWQMTASFGPTIPPGFHNLLFAAIDANGASGVELGLSVCVDTPVPDNLNICVPTRAPPPAVLSLSWDTPVDLNLVLETPSGVMIGEGVGAASADGGTTQAAGAGAPVLDHESNRNCVIDNLDRDDLVWQSAPETGTYQVWVDLFRACGQSAVTFTVSLWLSELQSDGTSRLVEQTPPVAVGELTALQANGGTAPGLFVGSFVLQ